MTVLRKILAGIVWVAQLVVRREPVQSAALIGAGALWALLHIGFNLNLSQSLAPAIATALVGTLLRAVVTPSSGSIVIPPSAVRKMRAEKPRLKTGRRAPDPAKVAKGILDFTPLLKVGATIPPPATEDYASTVDWSGTMDGNDQAGDCEAARFANWMRLLAAFLGHTAVQLSMTQIWAVYKTQNKGFVPGNGPHGYGSADDGGMDTQTLLEYLTTHGFDNNGNLVPASAAVPAFVVAFGKVDPTNAQAVETALAVFGSVWIDLLVQDAQQTQFGEGQPWTYVKGDPIEGGHAVLGGGYSPQKRAVCWAAEFTLSDEFWTATSGDGPMIESVWVVVSPLNLGSAQFLAGVDAPQLAADFLALTGKTLVLPTPTPTPVPTPGPTSVDAALAAALHRIAGTAAEPTYLRSAAAAWLTETGQ